jgi:hypothetical protein
MKASLQHSSSEDAARFFDVSTRGKKEVVSITSEEKGNIVPAVTCMNTI